MLISIADMGTVEAVRRADGVWARWTGKGPAGGLTVGDPVEEAGIPESIGEMTLAEFCRKMAEDSL